MKKIIVILTMAIVSCNSGVKTEEQGHDKASHEKAKEQHSAHGLQLNNGVKWEADDATQTNVAALKQVINDPAYASPGKRTELAASLQMKIDTLIKQCRMKGPEHDALHVWLEKLQTDMKDLKGEVEYADARAALKRDIDSFYSYFE